MCAVRGWTCRGAGRTGSGIALVAAGDRRAGVGGEVEDQLAVDHEVVVGLSEVADDHF